MLINLKEQFVLCQNTKSVRSKEAIQADASASELFDEFVAMQEKSKG